MAQQVYFDRTRKLGEAVLEKFFGSSSLQRASLKADHYESISGADSPVLALLELHPHVLNITAVPVQRGPLCGTQRLIFAPRTNTPRLV